MAYALQSGIHVSINGTNWYKLTDHNRREIEITPTLIEKESRMANGSLRKFSLYIVFIILIILIVTSLIEKLICPLDNIFIFQKNF